MFAKKTFIVTQQEGFLRAMDEYLPNNPILQCNAHLRSKYPSITDNKAFL